MNTRQQKKILGILIIYCLLCVLLSACHTHVPIMQTTALMDSLHMEWEKELQDTPMNGIVDLSTIFSFEWDFIEIVNSPLGTEEFDWKEIYDYDEEKADSLSTNETISALIFRQDDRIVDMIVYNYANPGSIVFRPYDHNNVSDVSKYPRREARFQFTYIGSFEEMIFVHVS